MTPDDPRPPEERLRRLGPFRLIDELDGQLPPWDPTRTGKLKLLFWLAFALRRKLLRAVAWVIFALAFGTILFTAFLAIFEPWNHSLLLWPTLSGSWFGELTIPGEPKQIVRLEINGDTENPPIAGTATTCDERGIMRTFEITGSPHGWRGRTFTISTSRMAEHDDEGVQLMRLDGEWARDAMRAAARVHHFRVVNGSDVLESSGSGAGPGRGDPVVRFTLERGGTRQFLAACSRFQRK